MKNSKLNVPTTLDGFCVVAEELRNMDGRGEGIEGCGDRNRGGRVSMLLKGLFMGHCERM